MSRPYTKTIFTGNVIEDPSGNKWIVSDTTDTHIHAVAFDAENCSAVQPLEDWLDSRTCHGCLDHGPDLGCETCHGTMSYDVNVKGWKRSKVLATNVRDFILKGVKKTWGI
jgi:hypothetical protein